MNFFDSHCHFSPRQPDTSAILAAARSAGVTRVLVAGTSLAESAHAAALAAAETGVVAAAGVHPSDAPGFDGELAPFRELLGRPGVVAVGEIGLDYHYRDNPPERQRAVFAQFLALALAAGRPAVIHCRDAFADCFAMVRDAVRDGLRFEIHCVAGTPAEAEQWLALGACLGFSGIVTFPKGGNVRDILLLTPPARILIETDSPWLTPVPHRGRPNCPAYVAEVARAVADLRGLTLEQAAALTTANACRFFGIAGG